MVDQFTYINQGNLGITLAPELNSSYNNPSTGDGVTQGGGESTGFGLGGGGGSSSTSGGGSSISSPSSIPASRTISFNVTSSPQGAAIIIDGVDSGRITPYTLQYSETQLLTPKTISLVNGSSKSTQTYILFAEMVTNQIGNSNTGGSYGGGYSGGGSNSGAGGSGGSGGFGSQVISDNEPFNPSKVDYGKPREAQK